MDLETEPIEESSGVEHRIGPVVRESVVVNRLRSTCDADRSNCYSFALDALRRVLRLATPDQILMQCAHGVGAQSRLLAQCYNEPVRPLLRALFVGTMFVSIGYTTSAAEPAQASGLPRESDRDVIQLCLLSFFQKEEWHSADWTPENHVVLRPEFRVKVRGDFAAALDEEIRRANQSLEQIASRIGTEASDDARHAQLARLHEQTQKDLAALQSITKRMSEGPQVTPPPLVQPAALTWDKRIRVTERSNRYRSFKQNLDKTLERSTVYALAEPPRYSPNGRYAFVKFHIPWSIHSADVSFFLEREGDSWRRVLVRRAFYF
jgi:hypothetical protein